MFHFLNHRLHTRSLKSRCQAGHPWPEIFFGTVCLTAAGEVFQPFLFLSLQLCHSMLECGLAWSCVSFLTAPTGSQVKWSGHVHEAASPWSSLTSSSYNLPEVCFSELSPGPWGEGIWYRYNIYCWELLWHWFSCELLHLPLSTAQKNFSEKVWEIIYSMHTELHI